MSDYAIIVENVSKRYRLSKGDGPLSGPKTLLDYVKLPYRRFCEIRGLTSFKDSDKDVFWALQDINLQIKHGEVLGIIGRNGAGKSTLLKILSRITAPTSGRVEIFGRVSSLLEVGTGFNPELTGRENIYMNGTIHGMRKREIDPKLDEIIEFAGVDKFIDIPIKRYSSGMHVRLGFAVAAHLEPEILIVDEVLAVGDAEFQKKCLGKMGQEAKEGRTVLFVSHNMGAIQQLCSRAVLLNNGTILKDDVAGRVVGEYLTMGLQQMGERVWPNINKAPGDAIARLRAVRVLDLYGKVCTAFDVRDPVFIQMEYCVLVDTDWFNSTFYLYNERGELIFVLADDTTDTPSGSRPRSSGLYRSTCKIPADFLNDGQFYVQVNLTGQKEVHTIQCDVLMFNVGDKMDPNGVRGNYRAEWARAAVRPKFEWNMEYFRQEEAEIMHTASSAEEQSSESLISGKMK